MRKPILLALVALLCLSLLAIADEQQKKNYNFEVGNRPVLKFNNAIGDLKIEGWEKDYIAVEMAKYAKGRSSKKLIGLLRESIRQNGDTVIIDVSYPTREAWKGDWKKSSDRLGVNFKIQVPITTRVDIRSLVTGEVEISDISGRLYCELITGSLKGENISGDIEIACVSGSVDIDGLNGISEIGLTSGNLELSDVTGELEIFMTSGDASIEAIDLEGLEFSNTSGNLELEVDSALTFGTFIIHVMSGDVDIEIPGSSTFAASLESASGNVRSDFDLKKTAELMDIRMEGVVNGGGATITVSGFSVEINLKRK